MKRLALCCLLLLPALAVAGEARRPMKVEDLFRFKRIAEPQISPDGKWIVYAVSSVSLEKNKSVSSLWLASTDKAGAVKQLTDSNKEKEKSDKSDRRPRWSPDGKSILFESNRSG